MRKSLKMTLITILIAIDFIITGWATNLFIIRMVAQNDINLAQKEEIVKAYNYIYENDETKWLADFIYKFWGDKKMIRTFTK